MTLLSLVRAACDEVGVARPNSVMAGADQTARAMLRAAQAEGRELARRWGWQALTKERVFASVAQPVQTDALPADFSRMVPDTFWNRTMQRRVIGPLTSDEWQSLRATVANPVVDAFRIVGDQIELIPTPGEGWTFAYEYVSKNWCRSGDGTAYRDQWADDSDEPLLDEEIITLGVIWRFKRSRGLTFEADLASYEAAVQAAIGRDGGRRTLNLAAPSYAAGMPTPPQPPEGSWMA